MMMESDSEFVNVAIRIKPVSKIENQSLKIVSNEPPVLLLTDRSQTFVFDNIFTEETSQESIYKQSIKSFVDYVKQGYNCTIFAYGQTGTGKTYTMGTDPNIKDEDEFGLIPRALKDFFQYDNNSYSETEIALSFIEIYNEKVFDLLQNDNPQLQVKGLKAQGFCKEKVFSTQEARHFLTIGNKNRHTSGTKQNTQSSRSHAIFTIYCSVRHEDKVTSGKLNLVDLAGCESVRKTGTQGSIFQEGVNINKGLLSIGQVMAALSNNANFIPYRQSIITSILQDSLNRLNFISLIACVSPLADDTTETLQTLDFAQRVKKFKSKPEINEIISQYRQENPGLFYSTPFKNTPLKNTPFKRPMSMFTPRPTKKAKPTKPLETVTEPSDTTDLGHSTTSFSSSVGQSSICSSVSSTGGPDLTHLSPILKKYLSAWQTSFQNELQSVNNKMDLVLNTCVKRPIVPKEKSKEESDGLTTPCIQWSKVHSELTQIVKREIAQLTLSKTNMATSSPIAEPLEIVKKTLNYDVNSPINENKENNFKIPVIPIRKLKLNNKTSLALSPIENVPLVPRRSIRLSVNRTNKSTIDFENPIGEKSQSLLALSFLGNETLTTNLTNETIVPRRSTRLSVQRVRKDLQNTIQSSYYFNQQNESLSLADDDNDKVRPKKRKRLTIRDTPVGKRLMGKQKDTPSTAHTKNVLSILNSRKIKDIKNLHTVGPKTAQQISLYIELKGELNRISDLKNMPGWGAKKMDRFIEHNILKKNLV